MFVTKGNVGKTGAPFSRHWISRMIMNNKMKVVVLALLLIFTGCSGSLDEALNPNADAENSVPKGGERSNRPILEGSATAGGSVSDKARHALEVLASYRRAQDPEPGQPVRYPAVVRKVWIPDHQNGSGDLVPSHYYFLEVLPERWAVQDAYELEEQLRSGSNSGSIPWTVRSR